MRRGLTYIAGIAAGVILTAPLCAQELVFNGGFETGSFSGWNVPPYVPGQGSDAQIFGVASDGGHSGMHYAGLSSAQLRFISQLLPTTAGQDYELTFWERRPSNFPAQVQVRWEGQVVYNSFAALPDGVHWHPFTVQLHANFNGSFIEFGQHFFPAYMLIDDISVRPVPGPGGAALLLVGGGVVAMRGRRRGFTAETQRGAE